MSDRFHPNYEVSVCTETVQEYSTIQGVKPNLEDLIITLCVSWRISKLHVFQWKCRNDEHLSSTE